MKSKIKKKVKVLHSAFALVMAVLLGFVGVAEAYSVSTSGSTTISPTNTNFKNAKSPMYDNKYQIINGSISDAYEMDIYHYECQMGGYYQVYTIGNTDTVGAVYEEENSLFSSPTYKRRAFNDVGRITACDNFSMIVNMDKWEDYYVCVRGYNNRKGSYTLLIEPNKDRVLNKNYGVWNCKYVPYNIQRSNSWTTRKIYITKEQAILYYWMLEPSTTIKSGNTVYTVEQLKTLYDLNPSRATNILITELSIAVGLASTVAGITTSIVGMFVSESLATSSLGKSSEQMMKEKLLNICGVRHVANATTWSGEWSAKNGMMIKEIYMGNYLVPFSYRYEKHYENDSLTGEEWYYGTWKH